MPTNTADVRSQPDAAQFPPYRPKTPWFGGHLQTLRTKLQRPGNPVDEFESERIVLPLEDGTGDSLVGRLLRPNSPRAQSDAGPLVVLLHGLGGTSQSTYMKLSAGFLLNEGHRVVLLNFRGAGLSKDHCDRLHHPGRTDDIASLLAALRRRDEHQLLRHGIVLVGYSLGGNVLLKFLGELATAELKIGASPIRGAVTVSAPLNLAATAKCLRRISRWPYQKYLLHRMRKQALHDGTDLTEEERKAVRKAKSVWEFDKHFTCRRCGYGSVEEYYSDNSALRFLPEISVPTLLIYASDDPFIPPDEYESFDWDEHSQLIPLVTSSGGHVGFHSANSSTAWHNLCIHSFVEQIRTLHQDQIGC